MTLKCDVVKGGQVKPGCFLYDKDAMMWIWVDNVIPEGDTTVKVVFEQGANEDDGPVTLSMYLQKDALYTIIDGSSLERR